MHTPHVAVGDIAAASRENGTGSARGPGRGIGMALAALARAGGRTRAVSPWRAARSLRSRGPEEERTDGTAAHARVRSATARASLGDKVIA